jgi:hypothetical protein
VEKSGSRTSLSRFAHTSTSTSSKYKDKDDDKDKDKINDEVYDKDNGKSSRVDATRVGMVAGQSMEKSGINSLQKKTSRSATRMMRSNGQLTGSVNNNERIGMDLEESIAQ